MKQAPGNHPIDLSAALDELAELLEQTSRDATNWRTLMRLLAERGFPELSPDEIAEQHCRD